MKLQLALDMLTYEDAVKLAGEVEKYIDIIEIGTPFIIKDGMAAVRGLREAFPDKIILADVKIMDGGKAEASYAFEAGADIVTVLAAAEDQTIRNVVTIAEEHGGQVMADMLAVHDIQKRAAEIDSFGVDYICVHTAFDIQHTGKNPLDELKLITEVVRNSKPAVAGGIKLSTLEQAVMLHPEIIVVGNAIAGAEDRASAAKAMRDLLIRCLGA